MSKQYTIKEDENGAQYVELVEGDSLTIIPINPANSHYQDYLVWLAAQDA